MNEPTASDSRSKAALHLIETGLRMLGAQEVSVSVDEETHDDRTFRTLHVKRTLPPTTGVRGRDLGRAETVSVSRTSSWLIPLLGTLPESSEHWSEGAIRQLLTVMNMAPDPHDANVLTIGLGSLVAGAIQERDNHRASKDVAYTERNKLVAVLTSLPSVNAWLADHPADDTTWSDDWRTIVFLELPGVGQVTWHLHDSHVPMFAHLERRANKWDGHDTPTKWARVEEYASGLRSLPKHAQHVTNKEQPMLSVAEFKRLGFLQEINRLLLHPCGLALALEVDPAGEANGHASVIDHRDDPEGVYYGAMSVPFTEVEARVRRVDVLRKSKRADRVKLFGAVIQPIADIERRYGDGVQAERSLDVQELGVLGVESESTRTLRRFFEVATQDEQRLCFDHWSVEGDATHIPEFNLRITTPGLLRVLGIYGCLSREQMREDWIGDPAEFDLAYEASLLPPSTTPPSSATEQPS